MIAARHDRLLARWREPGLCPFDLHRLVPIPDGILQLGEDDPHAQDWLRAHWGTTQLRTVRIREEGQRPPAPPQGGDRLRVPVGRLDTVAGNPAASAGLAEARAHRAALLRRWLTKAKRSWPTPRRPPLWDDWGQPAPGSRHARAAPRRLRRVPGPAARLGRARADRPEPALGRRHDRSVPRRHGPLRTPRAAGAAGRLARAGDAPRSAAIQAVAAEHARDGGVRRRPRPNVSFPGCRTCSSCEPPPVGWRCGPSLGGTSSRRHGASAIRAWPPTCG